MAIFWAEKPVRQWRKTQPQNRKGIQQPKADYDRLDNNMLSNAHTIKGKSATADHAPQLQASVKAAPAMAAGAATGQGMPMSVSATAAKSRRSLITSTQPAIHKMTSSNQMETVRLHEMAKPVETKESKKQWDALVSELKGLRKDLKNHEEPPAEINNPLLRETIIQSRNLFG